MLLKRYLITRIQTAMILLVAIVGILAVAFASPVFAHEGRDVGDYNFVVGFFQEPAYEGQLNAISLVVTKIVSDHAEEEPEDDGHGHSHDEDEEDDSNDDTTGMMGQMGHDVEVPPGRVVGLASTLQVEVTHLATGVSRVMALRELFNDPGHYVAELVPTSPGDYRVRFFGSIEGNEVDETFDSGPTTFATITDISTIQFPVVLESDREIQNATQGALDAVQELESDLDAASSAASMGMIVGIIGIVFGVIATGVSVFAINIARKRS